MIDCQKPGDCAYPGCECEDDGDPFSEESAMTQTQQAKRTPGPWELDDELQVCAGNLVIAHGDAILGPKDYATKEANARLIAAAPELLAALTMAAAGFATIANNLPATAEAARLVALDNFKACEAIIAKAEGR